MLDVVAQAEARGIAGRTGFGTTPRMLQEILRLSAAEARTRIEYPPCVTDTTPYTRQTGGQRR